MDNKEKLQNEISYWLDLEKDGIILKDNELFKTWINKENNKIEFQKEKNLLAHVESLPIDFLDEIKKEVNNNIVKRKKRRKTIYTFVSLASAACILALFYSSFLIDNKELSKNYMASNKIREQILLPDNSIVSLDSDTSMEISFYKDRREAFLSKGKAFFSVSSNKEKPFFVNTKNISIKVLGTEFEVINNDKFQVNVKEGKVRVSNKNDKLIALLTKEQSLTLDSNYNLKSIEKKASSSMARWTKAEFIFKQKNLKDVIAEFKKYKQIKVEIYDKSLESLPISGSFKVSEFDKFMSALPLVHDVNIINKDGKFIIKKRN